MSAVVIKACVLKGGQSIRLAASTSHQTSAKNDSPGPGGLLALPREAASNRWLRSGVCNNHSRGHGRPECQRCGPTARKKTALPLRGAGLQRQSRRQPDSAVMSQPEIPRGATWSHEKVPSFQSPSRNLGRRSGQRPVP